MKLVVDVNTTLVVIVPVIDREIEVVVVDDNAGFLMLKIQNEGSVIGAESGPLIKYFDDYLCRLLTTKFGSTTNT